MEKILSEPCGRAGVCLDLRKKKHDSLILSCESTSLLCRSCATSSQIPADCRRTSVSQNSVWKSLALVKQGRANANQMFPPEVTFPWWQLPTTSDRHSFPASSANNIQPFIGFFWGGAGGLKAAEVGICKPHVP